MTKKQLERSAQKEVWRPPELKPLVGTVAKPLPEGIKCKYCSKPLKVKKNTISKITWVYCVNVKGCPNYMILRNAANYGRSWGTD